MQDTSKAYALNYRLPQKPANPWPDPEETYQAIMAEGRRRFRFYTLPMRNWPASPQRVAAIKSSMLYRQFPKRRFVWRIPRPQDKPHMLPLSLHDLRVTWKSLFKHSVVVEES